jgi:translation initiation factor IF-1
MGTVNKVMGNNNYLVEIGEGEKTREILCHLGGKMRQFKINILPGDAVTLQVPAPYDKGRITYRGAKPERADRGSKKKKRTKKKGR